MSDRTERCKAKNRSGQPCSATPPFRDGWCKWHDPERAEERTEQARKAGKARSNVSRARKRMRGGIVDFATLQGMLFEAVDQVRSGKLEPGQATAMANLARAMRSLADVATFNEQLNSMATEISELKAARVA